MYPRAWLLISLGVASVVPLANDAIALDGQPLASNVRRLIDAFHILGQPLPGLPQDELLRRCQAEDGPAIEALLDPFALAIITINPESKVKAKAGSGATILQQAGFTAFLIKIINQGSIKSPLRIRSPQAGPSYGGVTPLAMERQDQQHLIDSSPSISASKTGILTSERNTLAVERRFAHLQWYDQPPMTPTLSGNEVEYAILLVYVSDAGKREIVLDFSVGSGTQDLGFRAEVPILFTCRPAIPVRLEIVDSSEPKPFARITVRDSLDRVYPPQVRRLAPDFFFQPHVYRCSDEFLFLPPGKFTVESSRGPEYLRQIQTLEVPETVEGSVEPTLKIHLRRWVEPRRLGWYSGDHHIHGAGCAHYQSPTEGVTPRDMFRQINGEGLNVGCLLTWGPCFEFQRQFFRPTVDQLSTPSTLLKYDLEISGFGSQALGHVCLLNLRDQNYPGSEGTKTKGWPTWTTPVLRWAKEQGAVTGFAHSASGLQIDAQQGTQRLFEQFDQDRNDLLDSSEVREALLPDSFQEIDQDADRVLNRVELARAIDRAADRLPNTAIPQMDSVGAMELPVAVTEGVCDFISTMDTPRIAEWNMWYHILNCGFSLKASGETDFPCMSGTAVGQGRSYVQLGKEPLTFDNWCRNLAAGRSYVSDGYAHVLTCEASVENQRASVGESLKLSEPRTITVTAKVAFAPEMPESIAYGTRRPAGGERWLGDTVTLHGPRSNAWVAGGPRQVELIVNGQVRGTKTVVADGQEYDVEFNVLINQSSWLAIRVFPQVHTNPLEVFLGEQPIRASSQSARWCEETIHQLWRVREKNIHPNEVAQAEATFQRAIAVYRQRAKESNPAMR